MRSLTSPPGFEFLAWGALKTFFRPPQLGEVFKPQCLVQRRHQLKWAQVCTSKHSRISVLMDEPSRKQALT